MDSCEQAESRNEGICDAGCFWRKTTAAVHRSKALWHCLADSVIISFFRWTLHRQRMVRVLFMESPFLDSAAVRLGRKEVHGGAMENQTELEIDGDHAT